MKKILASILSCCFLSIVFCSNAVKETPSSYKVNNDEIHVEKYVKDNKYEKSKILKKEDEMNEILIIILNGKVKKLK